MWSYRLYQDKLLEDYSNRLFCIKQSRTLSSVNRFVSAVLRALREEPTFCTMELQTQNVLVKMTKVIFHKIIKSLVTRLQYQCVLSIVGSVALSCQGTYVRYWFYIDKVVLITAIYFNKHSKILSQTIPILLNFIMWLTLYIKDRLFQRGSYIDKSVPCFVRWQRNDFKESTEYSSEYNLYY